MIAFSTPQHDDVLVDADLVAYVQQLTPILARIVFSGGAAIEVEDDPTGDDDARVGARIAKGKAHAARDLPPNPKLL